MQDYYFIRTKLNLTKFQNKTTEKAKSKESLSITPSPIAALKESANSLPGNVLKQLTIFHHLS